MHIDVHPYHVREYFPHFFRQFFQKRTIRHKYTNEPRPNQINSTVGTLCSKESAVKPLKMFRNTILKTSLRSPLAQRVLQFHTSAIVAASKGPAKKAFIPGHSRKKGQKGANKTFLEYVNNKRFKQNASKVLSVPLFENDDVAKLVKQSAADSTSADENKIFKFSEKVLPKLHYLGSFKKGQFNELFAENVSFVRKEALSVIDHLQQNFNADSSKNKFILFGESGIGKTTLLSQLQAYLINKEAIILSIPYTKEIIDGSHEFSYNSQTQLYEQPTYIKKFLTRTLKANKDLLSKIPLSESVSYNTVKLSKDNYTLADLLSNGVSNKVPKFFYPSVFRDFIKELRAQKSNAVYLTIDNFNAFAETPYTSYKTADFESVYTDQLEVTKFVLDLASDAVKFNKGGVILTNGAEYPITKTLKVPFGLEDFSPFDGPEVYDARFARYLTKKNINLVYLDKLPKNDVKQLVEWYLENDLILEKDKEVTESELNKEKLQNEKYFLSGNGNPRELIKACTLLY